MAMQVLGDSCEPSTQRQPDPPASRSRIGRVAMAAWRRLQSTNQEGTWPVRAASSDAPEARVTTELAAPDEICTRVASALRVALDSAPAGSLSAGVRRRLEAAVHRELTSALTGEDRVGVGTSTQDPD